jgi:hypothetical protein
LNQQLGKVFGGREKLKICSENLGKLSWETTFMVFFLKSFVKFFVQFFPNFPNFSFKNFFTNFVNFLINFFHSTAENFPIKNSHSENRHKNPQNPNINFPQMSHF